MNTSNSIPKEWQEHDKQIRPYQWSHRGLGIAKSLLLLGFIVLGFKSNLFALLEWHLNPHTSSTFLLWLMYFGVLAVASELLSLPFAFAHQAVERHFQLSKQTYGSWYLDRMKGYALGAILGTVTLGFIYFCIQHMGPHWWAATCALLVLLSIVLAQLAPVLLIPMFYKLEPLEAGELKQRLLDMSTRFGVTVKDIYHLGLGEKTEKGNAAFVGIGKTKRIIIGDTLYKKFSTEEVEAVFAHELGHQVHNDLWKGIFFSTFLMFFTFYVANSIVQTEVFSHVDTSLDRPYGIFLFFVVLSILQMVTGFLSSAFSRARERAADRFAKEKIGSGKYLADALERLTYQNRGKFKPNALFEFFTYSHPAPWRRISALRNT